MDLFDMWKTGCDQIGNFFKNTFDTASKAVGEAGKAFADNFCEAWSNIGATYGLAFENFSKGNGTGGVAKFLEATAGAVGNGLTMGGANAIGNYVRDTNSVNVDTYVDPNTGAVQYATKASDLGGLLHKLGAGMANDQIEQDKLVEDGKLLEANVSGLKTLGKDAVAVVGTAVVVHGGFAFGEALSGGASTVEAAKDAYVATKVVRRGKLLGNIGTDVMALSNGSDDAKILMWAYKGLAAVGLSNLAYDAAKNIGYSEHIDAEKVVEDRIEARNGVVNESTGGVVNEVAKLADSVIVNEDKSSVKSDEPEFC